MRRLRFLPLGLFIMCLSCSRQEPFDFADSGTGGVTISLSASSSGTEESPVQTRATEERVPDTDDFIVEIYSLQGIRLYRDTYANSCGKRIPLNTGEYRLLAQYGDSAGVGFNAAWFSADRQFTVMPQETESIEAVARMNKVKVTVNYGENIRTDYPYYYSIVRHVASSKELELVKDESRPGYILPGMLVYELYVYNSASSKWYYASLEPREYKPNTFVTFNVELSEGEGAVGGISVEVDVSTEDVTKEYEVPFDAAPQDVPTVTLSQKGFDAENTFSFIEAVEYEGVKADIVAMGKIKDCILTVDSDYLLKKGVPEKVNLADPALDPVTEASLRAAGFTWPREMRGQRFANFDLSYLSENIRYSPESGLFEGSFMLEVTDSAGHTVSEPAVFSVIQQPVEFSASEINQSNAFARRLSGLSAAVNVGNPDALSVQYRKTNAEKWSEVKSSGAGTGQQFGLPEIKGLVPETEYEVRVIYNSNEHLATNIATITTEPAAQIGNSGFEDWTTRTHKFTYNFFGSHSHDIDWDQPWGNENDKWWAVNSKKTMPSSTSVVSANWNWVRFPTVAYTTDACQGSHAAMVYSVNVGDWVTDAALVGDRVAGELFIGTSDDKGNRTSEGHAFKSRPDTFRFYYKYMPKDNETAYVKFELRDRDGNVITSAESDLGSSSDWTKAEFPLTYQDMNRQADSIYIIFKSTMAEKPAVTGNFNLIIRDNESYEGNFGSILMVDALELVYE